MRVELAQGDITRERVDAIVNAANSSLLGGGGVDGAIHRAAGPEILAACRELRAGEYAAGLPTGEAAATTGGRLAARWAIHTVGPIYSVREDRSALLRSCYARSLEVGASLGATSIAFPLISSGLYRWPAEEAIRIALAALADAPDSYHRVRLILHSDEHYALAQRAG
jgi:O-acetyl-ADP-ribose deacetylase (regulator of RNase III)